MNQLTSLRAYLFIIWSNTKLGMMVRVTDLSASARILEISLSYEKQKEINHNIIIYMKDQHFQFFEQG